MGTVPIFRVFYVVLGLSVAVVWPAAPAKSDAIELAFVGDIIFGRYRRAGHDPIPAKGFEVFAEMAAVLKADVAVGNLETPLVRVLPKITRGERRYRFAATAEHAKHLVKAGFKAVSLANNHRYDMQRLGLKQTPAILRELGVMPLGASSSEGEPRFRVETLVTKGWRVGFIAVTTHANAGRGGKVPTLPYLRTSQIRKKIVPLIRAAHAAHDLMVVQIHWGKEYAEEPSRAQIRAGRSMVAAGADFVIGHHPHVLQAIERFGKGIIAYSMGNFLFENTHPPARYTGVLRATVSREGPMHATFHPAYIKRNPVPHPAPATGYIRRRVIKRVRSLSKQLGTRWQRDAKGYLLLKNR